MSPSKMTLRDHLRLIWTIGSKDIRDVVKNKTTLTIILTALFVVALYRLIPILTSSGTAPEMIIADPGKSEFVLRMADSQAFQVYSRPDLTAMIRRASASEASNLALVVPPGFDRMLAEGHAPTLQGYTLYWVSPEKAAELRQAAENELTHLAGTPVRISAELTPIYPALLDNSLANWAGLALVLVLVFNLQLIPNLMLEEKQTHTLDALQVSPASAGHLASGKAVTGLFYAILAAGVVLAVYSNLILHWGLMALAVLLGALFITPLGLLIGQKVESRAQLGLWIWIIFIPVLVPALIVLMNELFPRIFVDIAWLIPTGALLHMILSAFSQHIVIKDVIVDVGIVLLWSAPLFGLLVWSLLRMDRLGSARRGIFTPAKSARLSLDETEDTQAESQALDEPSSLPGLLELAATHAAGSAGPARSRGLPIVLAIAAKDLRESLRNRVALLVILGALIMILINSALPLLLSQRIEPLVLVYDRGSSALLRYLRDQTDIRVGQARSQREMESELGDLPQTYLGLTLPPDFDQRLANGETVDLDATIVHWADRATAARLAGQFSQAAARLTPGKVNIDSQYRIVYPALEGFGQTFMVAQIMTFVLLIIGFSLVPLLLVEEKETHTIDALLVSPARTWQVIAGKALVGFFYCTLAAALILALNSYLFVNWGVVLLAVVAGMTFAVALGLLVGAYSNNPASVGLWGGMVLLVLVASGLLSLFSNAAWPLWLRQLLVWLPGGVLIRMFRSATVGTPQAWIVLGGAGILFALALLIYALAAQRLGRTVRS